MHYEISGKGKPLLFIHGWTMNSRVWKEQVRYFSKHFQVITVDLRGHGLSKDLGGPYNFETFAEDVVVFVKEKLMTQRVTLIGWSMGVFVSLKVLSKERNLFDSLIIISGTPVFTTKDDYPYGIPLTQVRLLHRKIRNNYLDALKDFYRNLFSKEESEKIDERDFIESLILPFVPSKQVALCTLKAIEEADFRQKLKSVQTPTLIIHGAKDAICLPEASYFMHTQLKNSCLEVFSLAGHVPFFSEKDRFNRVVEKFLRRL